MEKASDWTRAKKERYTAQPLMTAPIYIHMILCVCVCVYVCVLSNTHI